MDVKIKQIYIKNIVYSWQISRLKSTSAGRKFIALEWDPIKLFNIFQEHSRKEKKICMYSPASDSLQLTG